MAKDSTAKVENKAEAKIWESLISEFGGNSMFRADEKARFSMEGVPLPSIALGAACGTFELPFGKIGLFYGAEGSGKSLTCLLAIKETQKKYPKTKCVLVDAEGSADRKWMAQLGIDLSRLMIVNSSDGVEIFSILCGVYNDKTGKKTKLGILDRVIAGELDVKLIVLDSIANIQPPQEAGRSFSSNEISPLPKFLNRSLRFCRPMLAKAGAAMLTVNHLRIKMDGHGGTYFPGGNTLKHQCDLIVKQHPSTKAEMQILDEHGNKQGHGLICTCEKTRFGPNRHQAGFFLDFRFGVVRLGEELATVAVAFGVVQHPTPQSSWVYGEHSVKGKEKFGQLLESDPKLFKEVFDKVKANKDAGVEGVLEVSDEAKEAAKDVEILVDDEA